MHDFMVRRRGGLIEAEVDGELVGLHVDNGVCYGFNSTATQIWAMIAEPRRLSSVRDELVRTFDVDPETCERDVLQVLRELEADALVELQAISEA